MAKRDSRGVPRGVDPWDGPRRNDDEGLEEPVVLVVAMSADRWTTRPRDEHACER